MKTPSPPRAPDPRETAQTQGQLNRQFATAQQQQNMVGQSTPFGSLSYSQVGSWADGTPRYEATTSLSPQHQQLFDTTMGAANTLASRIATQAGQPVPLGTEVQDRLQQLGNERLRPMLAERRTAAEADLLNRGLTMGSEAYDNAMRRVTEGENDANNQLILSGWDRAQNMALAERQLPYQELAALTGATPGMPQFQSTPQAQIAAPDYQGAAAQQYQGQMNAYNQQMQSRNALLGGLFGLGNTLLANWGRQGFPTPRF